jgi:ankyrin repeat protein
MSTPVTRTISTPLHNILNLAYHSSPYDSECLSVVRLLLEREADVNAYGGYYPRTPLHVLSSHPVLDVSVVRLLLERRADVNACDSHHRTPLHSISLYGDPNTSVATVVRLLLEHGANRDIKDHEGRTSYQIALSEGRRYHDLLQLLSDYRGCEE